MIWIFSDLLEGGLSTGETLRLLFTPYRRKLPSTEETTEPEPADEAGKTEEDENKEEQKSVPDEQSELGEQISAHASDSKEIVDLQRAWFNLVCYGLPNLIVAQV